MDKTEKKLNDIGFILQTDKEWFNYEYKNNKIESWRNDDDHGGYFKRTVELNFSDKSISSKLWGFDSSPKPSYLTPEEARAFADRLDYLQDIEKEDN